MYMGGPWPLMRIRVYPYAPMCMRGHPCVSVRIHMQLLVQRLCSESTCIFAKAWSQASTYPGLAWPHVCGSPKHESCTMHHVPIPACGVITHAPASCAHPCLLAMPA